jgi:hypothetical protein
MVVRIVSCLFHSLTALAGSLQGCVSAMCERGAEVVDVNAGPNKPSCCIGCEVGARYRYDGQNWPIQTLAYTGGSLTETRDHYHLSNWQLIEDRVGAGSITNSFGAFATSTTWSSATEAPSANTRCRTPAITPHSRSGSHHRLSAKSLAKSRNW